MVSLTDLPEGREELSRVLHGLAARSPTRFLRRAAEVGWEVAWTGLLDRLAPLKGDILREEAGRAVPRGGALGLYLHWSPDGRVSEMVRGQVAGWRGAGFDMVFVSNAAVPDRDWDAVGKDTVLRLARRNVGRDFGAWRDAAARVLPRLGRPAELLLANDSVLGPIRPMDPLLAAWRAGGEGLFGMTESRGGGAHLQSYALLARGAGVGVLLDHLAAVRDFRSKWRTVQQGEIGLSERFRAAGLRRAALFGYAAACAATDTATRAALGPRFAAADAMLRYPLNPTHHLWRVLVERMGFPYLKTELVLRNPGRLPGVADWRDVVPPAALPMIEAHLALMARR
ncbi:MAG: hypothetical protein K2X11_01535 [Acetobacteraceae bacterium]|nr:hypothetical protein [Acetobacteraceae bacterium]